MDEIIYELSVYSQDSSLNITSEYRKVWNDIQHRQASCSVMGEIKKITD
jgi:hypothetical protein